RDSQRQRRPSRTRSPAWEFSERAIRGVTDGLLDRGADARVGRADARRVVIATAECVCDLAFNLHGISPRANFATPLDRRQRTDPVSTAPSAPWPGLSRERDDWRSARFAHRSTSAARGRARSRCRRSVIPGYTYFISENEEASSLAAL